MGNDPNSIRTLREFYRSRRALDYDAAFRELQGESDRAAVILAAAGLEDVLKDRIVRKLRKSDGAEADVLFGANRPLSTFSAKIDIAYFLRIIDTPVREQLHDLREMRNACAHSQYPISFKDSALANVTRRLFKPRGYINSSDVKPDKLKAAFLIEMAMVEHRIFAGSKRKAFTRANAVFAEMKKRPEPSLRTRTKRSPPAARPPAKKARASRRRPSPE